MIISDKLSKKTESMELFSKIHYLSKGDQNE